MLKTDILAIEDLDLARRTIDLTITSYFFGQDKFMIQKQDFNSKINGSTLRVMFNKVPLSICSLSLLLSREPLQESLRASSASASVFAVQIDLISNLGSTS